MGNENSDDQRVKGRRLASIFQNAYSQCINSHHLPKMGARKECHKNIFEKMYNGKCILVSSGYTYLL